MYVKTRYIKKIVMLFRIVYYFMKFKQLLTEEIFNKPEN